MQYRFAVNFGTLSTSSMYETWDIVVSTPAIIYFVFAPSVYENCVFIRLTSFLSVNQYPNDQPVWFVTNKDWDLQGNYIKQMSSILCIKTPLFTLSGGRVVYTPIKGGNLKEYIPFNTNILLLTIYHHTF